MLKMRKTDSRDYQQKREAKRLKRKENRKKRKKRNLQPHFPHIKKNPKITTKTKTIMRNSTNSKSTLRRSLQETLLTMMTVYLKK